MDIKSAAKAHHSEQKLDERTLTTEYHEPAAIPCPGTLYSGSGPPNPPGASTGSRFSSHGGSEDLSGSFERSSHFYERGERGETTGSAYIRRGGSSSSSGAYHSAESISRSRARDRLYRNGPYTPLIERVVSRSASSGHHRVSSSGWGYDSPSPRYSAGGVPSTPELPYTEDRRETTPVVHKKHSKSGISRRSGSDSASNSGSSGSRSRSSSASSQSGSSTCSSASSSPTSEKSCSTHSQQSSLRSGAQSGVSASHTNSVSPAVHSEDRRPLAICVRNLPARSSDTSLKDGLYHEYKKHGKVTWVKVVGQGVDRYALVCFKKADDVEKALQVSHDKLFFGCKIEVAPYQGYDVDDNEFRPFEAEQDEFHPKATRTLFIGNLEKDITTQEIRKHFDQFGEIIEIDIKKQGNSASYAFCQFSDISSVVRAMRTLDGEHIGANRIKLGFGKSMHSNCVWVDGVAETVSEKYLSTHFGQFGPVTQVVIDRSRGHALVFYEQITYAQQAVKDMRGNSLRGRKLQVDYASRECQEALYDRIDKQSCTSHSSNFENSVQASPQGSSTIARVYENSPVATSPAINSAPTRYPTLTTGGSGVVVTTRFNTTNSTSRATYNRPSASSPTTPSPSPRSSRHGHSSATQRFEYNLEYNSERRFRNYEENPSCEDGGNSGQPMTGSGEIRHFQKDRVTLVDQLEDCASSGDDTATGRRRCSKHRRSQSGGEGSRPGTPLCDERPDPPVEPRRLPRERPPDPLSLPLPRFAAQVLSPRPALPSPPASPQTPHSSSSDSEPSPPSPEWEERLRSLDEKYEKWSGSRSGVTKLDPSTLKIKHKLLELDLHELQPSEIVKSVLAKRSVFDEDSKRLENFGEKYEPREFIPASRTNVLRRLDMSPLPSPINKSPGLQYPFPSHPPVQPISSGGLAPTPANPSQTVAPDSKPSNTFLTNCTRQFTPKISSPSSSSVETVPRPSTLQHADKFKSKCTPAPIPAPSSKKDVVTTPPPKPKPCSIRRDSSEEKSELRRKSRDEVCTESVAKKDDISESDKVKDAQISERRKSSVDKRRGSVDIKDFSNSKPSNNSCDRPKDTSDKQEEKRRGSSDTDPTPALLNDPRLKPDSRKTQESNDPQPYDNIRVSESDKKRAPSDTIERRKEIESLHRHNSTENQDKKKDVLGVNSEKDRRRGRESFDNSSDNPKLNRKVPDCKKETEVPNERREKSEELSRHVDQERKKDSPENQHQGALNKSKEKREAIDKEKRRDSKDESAEKSKNDKTNENDRFKDYKKNDNIEMSNSKKKEHHEGDKLSKKDEESRNSRREDHDESKKDSKHKEERRRNSENEISKEHSLFKKVFGFADSIRHHKAGNVDRRDNDTSSAVKTDTPEPSNKHRDKKEKKERDEHSDSKHKPFNRKSPDNPEIGRHKEERRRHSESKRKEFDASDDLKVKEDNHVPLESKPHKSDRKKEDSSYKDSNHRNAFYEHNASEHTKYTRDSDRRKDPFQDDSKKLENDVGCLENNKKEDHNMEEYYERRKDDGFRSKDNDKRKGSIDGLNDGVSEKKNDVLDGLKYKHDRHKDKTKDHDVTNCRTKDEKKNELHDKHRNDKRKDSETHRMKEDKKINDESIFDILKQKENESKKEDYDNVKNKEDNFSLFRDSIRKKDLVSQDRLKEISDRKKEEKERRREREILIKESDEKRREKENDKLKSKTRDYDTLETKINGDHDVDYSMDSVECHKSVISYDVNDHRDSKKKEKREKNSWPATIGCKRRLSSQDSVENNDESKRTKPERRDSKDSGRSSSSSRKGSGEKHKGYKLLEEKIKEDREREQRKNADENNHESNPQHEDKTPKPAIRKEKRNSGDKRKEERKFKVRARENGTASESDMASGDDDQLNKATKRQQHSIFDIVDDEPAYISMYDKVKARSTKNMQKLEEEKRQEKLKEKFHALKQSRAKREEKKRSTSYDEDSDSEKSGMRRSTKHLLTSSEDDGCSEPDMKARKNKILYDTSEDDIAISSTVKNRKPGSHEENKSTRKIVSDISEDDSNIKHSTAKVKVNRSITFDMEPKSRKIMSDTSEDDSSRINSTPRAMKPSRINSDESEGDLGFEDSIKNETKPLQNISDMFHSRPVEVNHFTNSIREEPTQHPLQSSPESFRRNSLDSTASEQHRKKSHKKKQKRQKNLEDNEDGLIKKHSSKKDKKRAHRDKDEDEKRKKRAERENINKREDKMEDIFGPLSDDSVKAIGNKWNVAQVYGSDSESERENIRKKEKKRREKKLRELDEAGRAIEAKLLDSCDNLNLDEPVKTKKKKRKKSRDEKSKHHQMRDLEDAPLVLKDESVDESVEEKHKPVLEIKEAPEVAEEVEKKEDYEMEVKSEPKLECEEELDTSQNLRQQSMASLLDSPPPSQPSNVPTKKPGIPGFSSEIDENIHETAVKSISESNCTTLEDSDLKYDDKSKTEETPVTNEDGKPTTISQEETEDAVAALLMEDPFGGGFEGYNEDTPKPDTPVSEPDLQIDTDTEDTYDPIDFSRPPRTPDIPSNFYRQNDTREGLEERIMISLACSSDSSLKESPRPLQMPPTPDHKTDKKDNSDSDSFEPEKTLAKDKQSVVKQLVELSETEPSSQLSSDKEIPCETIPVEDIKKEKEEHIASSSPSPLEEPSDNAAKEGIPPSPETPPVPERAIPPSLDMPKLIVIPQKVPTISVSLQQTVPSLAPLSSKFDSLPNFQKVEKPFAPSPSLVRSVVSPVPQSVPPVTSSAPVTKPEMPVIVSMPSRVVTSPSKSIAIASPPQVWSSKVPSHTSVVSEPVTVLTVSTASQPKSPAMVSHSPAPLLPVTTVSSQEIPAAPSSVKTLHERVSSPAPNTPQPSLVVQQPIAQTVSPSQPPPLIQTLSKPPPLVHTSPVNIVTSSAPRSDVIASHTPNALQLVTPPSIPNINLPVQFAAKAGHRLPINPLPLLKPVLNTHISQPSSICHAKPTTTAPPLGCQATIASAPVRTIHSLASVTLVSAIKDPKSAVSPASSIPTPTLQGKQLHVITHTPQLSPSPPVSPQNLKLVRPSIAITSHVQVPPLQTINIQSLKTPVISQISPNRPCIPPAPLLQTVNIDDHIKSSANFTSKTLIPIPSNSQLLLTPIQAPHPEKVITLTPSQPFAPVQHSPVLLAAKPPVPVNVIKTSEPSPKELPPEPAKPKKDERGDDSGLPITPEEPSLVTPNAIKPSPAEVPSTKVTLKPDEDLGNIIGMPKKSAEVPVEPLIQNKGEPKEKPTVDVVVQDLALRAVIQDLAVRVANKEVWKSKTNTIEPIKSETCKPIEQVVRELALKKKQANEGKIDQHEAPSTVEPAKHEIVPLPEPEDLNPIEIINLDDSSSVEEIPDLKITEIEDVPPKTEEVAAKPVEDVCKEPEPVMEQPIVVEDDKPIEEDVPVLNVELPKVEEEKPIDSKPDAPVEVKSPKPVPAKDIRASAEKEAPKPDFVVSTPPARGGRGGRKRKGAGGRGAISTRRTRANNSTTTTPSTDIYEFRDDSEEETGRPRLILTIKSPPEPLAVAKVLPPAPQPSPQPAPAPPSPPPTPITSATTATTVSPACGAKTRKSRRLQEKDGTKTSADELIDEMVVTRGRPSRRATRSTVHTLAPPVETTRKSPRRKQTGSNLQIPVHNTRTRSASPLPALSPTPPQSNKSPTPQRHPSPVKTSNPQPVITSSSPATPQSSPQSSAPQPQPQPEPTTQPQPPPPPAAASPASVVVSTPCSVGQPTPPPTPSTPSSQVTPIASTPPVTITTAHAVSTTPVPAHMATVPAVTSHVQASPVPLTSHHPNSALPLQPISGQPPPAHMGPAHSLPVSSAHPMPGHHTPSAYISGQASAIKFRCKTSPGEPTKLIDPVTGLLIPMAESEEGQYVPIGDAHRTAGGNVAAHLNKEPSEGEPPEKRARLLNLVGKEEAIARTPLSRPSVVRPPASQPSSTPPTATPPAAHSQSVKILVSTSHPIEVHLNRAPQIPPALMGGAPTKVPLSGVVPMTPKSHLLQAVTPNRARPQAPPPNLLSKGPMAPKAHILQSVGNAQSREGVIGSPAPHQGSLLTGSVASPPLRAHQQPIVTGASSGRILMKSSSDSQSSRVGDNKQHVAAPSPSSQVQPARSQVVQPGIPLSAYEASLGEVVQHVSTYPPHHHYVHPPFVFQPPYLREAAGMPGPYHRSSASKGAIVKGAEIDDRPAAPAGPTSSAIVASPPLELRRGSPHDRTTDSPQVVPVYMHRSGQQFYYEGPPHPPPPAHRPHNPPNTGRLQTPPHASQVPPQADSLLMLLQRYPVMWQGLLALKNDQAAVQMHFVFGNPVVARESLPCNSDGSTPPLRIAQRMRLEQTQVEGVARKMQMDNEHCMLLALPCGRDHLDVLQQSNNLQNGFITYLQQKQAAGIVNIAAPGSPQPAYVVHIFPACDFANESLARIAPDLLHRVADLAHLLIVIATV